MSLNATQALELSKDAYCTMAHIQARLPHRTFGANSKPSKAQCVLIARGGFRQINAVLDVLGYVIPVASTNTTAIGYIQELNAIGAAAQIEGSTYSAGNETRSQYAVDLQNQFNLMWKTLVDGKVSLPDAARQAGYQHRADEKHPSYVFHEISGTEQDPVFTKEMKF